MKPTTYLPPGQIHVGVEPTVISTVLGSCVAVCLWDSARRIGGVNHYLLPKGAASNGAQLRYAVPAVESLIKKLLAIGGRPTDLRAKVFGGASIIAGPRTGPTLGAQNVEAGLRFLEELGIPVTASHTGGDRGMKLEFHTDTGEAWVKTL